MSSTNRTYIAMDLKSFYASVECVERNLNPFTTNLVVADESRTDKTICLAVTPPLKKYGLPGRPRLFEVKQKVREDFIVATPRMALYIDYSTRIYQVYLKYIAPEDTHVYSIDEVFMDVTAYLNMYQMSAYDLAKTIILDVFKSTGITATAGIGTNMYLCKVAMDIKGKKISEDKDGVRIAMLDEMSYRRELWSHRPLIDFWRVGRGYSKRLEEVGLYTMGDIARCSLGKPHEYYNEDLLYKIFGVNAELLIDHAWGYESCRMSDVKEYKPTNTSIGSGQVLQRAYTYDETRVVIQEMADSLVYDLIGKGLVTNQIVLHIGHDKESLDNPEIDVKYVKSSKSDYYGRKVPRHAHGTANLDKPTSSTKLIVEATMKLYDRIANKELLARRVSIAATGISPKAEIKDNIDYQQLNLFTDLLVTEDKKAEEEELKREENIQEAIYSVRQKYGKSAILKGTNFREGATGRDRNKQIGGHRA